jgi:acetyl-CoA synthetase
MQSDTLLPEGTVWSSDRDMREGANLTRFMQALGVESFEALNESANDDPAGFHDALIRFLVDYRFYRPYEQILDTSEGLPFARWCVGGTTNVVLNCLGQGVVVGMYLPNLPQAASALLAVAKIGVLTPPATCQRQRQAAASRAVCPTYTPLASANRLAALMMPSK